MTGASPQGRCVRKCRATPERKTRRVYFASSATSSAAASVASTASSAASVASAAASSAGAGAAGASSAAGAAGASSAAGAGGASSAAGAAGASSTSGTGGAASAAGSATGAGGVGSASITSPSLSTLSSMMISPSATGAPQQLGATGAPQQLGAGWQQTGAGSQQTGAGSQQTGAGSQQDDFLAKQPPLSNPPPQPRLNSLPLNKPPASAGAAVSMAATTNIVTTANNFRLIVLDSPLETGIRGLQRMERLSVPTAKRANAIHRWHLNPDLRRNEGDG